jgi:hypothetical protein
MPVVLTCWLATTCVFLGGCLPIQQHVRSAALLCRGSFARCCCSTQWGRQALCQPCRPDSHEKPRARTVRLCSVTQQVVSSRLRGCVRDFLDSAAQLLAAAAAASDTACSHRQWHGRCCCPHSCCSRICDPTDTEVLTGRTRQSTPRLTGYLPCGSACGVRLLRALLSLQLLTRRSIHCAGVGESRSVPGWRVRCEVCKV